MRRGRALVFALLVLAGGLSLGQGGWIYAKARLAQLLLHVAWQRALAGADAPRPWPWADTTPVARLHFQRGGDYIVLAGSTGRTLAFAPGHVAGTARPGSIGNCVIGGHRDTQFRVLRNARPGDVVTVQGLDGRTTRYLVDDLRIVDRHDTWVARNTPTPRLTLITCYPFDALIPGGPQRYVVRASLARQGL
jgi:sortase A